MSQVTREKASNNVNQNPRDEVNFWKPNSKNEGAAAFFNYSEGSNCVFLKMMPQASDGSDSKFDSSRSLNVKLGQSDIGELLAVIMCRKDGAGNKKENKWSGLYHEGKTGSSVIGFSRADNGNVFLSISYKADGSDAVRLSIPMTLGELECLRVFLEKYLSKMFVSI